MNEHIEVLRGLETRIRNYAAYQERDPIAVPPSRFHAWADELAAALAAMGGQGEALLTNPHTGTPRDYRDVDSDPAGVLIHKTDEPLRAAPHQPEPGEGEDDAWCAECGVKLENVRPGKHQHPTCSQAAPHQPEARVGGRGEAHPDDAAVDAFAAAMKAKLAEARAKDRGGWQNKADCSQQRLSDMLRAHVEKGDPRDVANFACFLWNRGEGIAPRQPEARVGGEDCHCATCTCASGMTPAIRFDASPAEREGAVRDQLIAMGWTPPQQSAPVVPEPPKETDHAQP